MSRLLSALFAVTLILPQLANAGGLLDGLSQYKKGNMKFGKLAVHPRTNLAEAYDSNIYLVPPDKPNGARQGGGVLGSWITDAQAGVSLKFPLSDMHKFSADYNMQGLLYAQQPSANNAFNQRANLGYNYAGPKGITGNVYNKYQNVDDPAFSELVERERRWQNSFGAAGEYAPKGGKLFAGASIDHTVHKYVGPALGASLNRYEQTFGIKGGYKIQPKTRLYAGYSRQIIHYTVIPNARNSKAHLFNFGVEGKLLPKVKGKVDTGVTLRDYDDNNTSGQTGYTRNWMVATNIVWNPRKRCEMRVGYSRALQESTFATNRFYINNNFTLAMKHKFPHKLTGRVNLGWGVDKYPESSTIAGITGNRRDDLYTQGIGVDYDVQEWIKLGLDYQHKERNSTFFDTYNYEQHLTTLSAKLTF